MEVEEFIEEIEQTDNESKYDFLFAEQLMLDEPSDQEPPEGKSMLISICEAPSNSISSKNPIEFKEAEICLFATVPSTGGHYEIQKKYSLSTPEEYYIDATGSTLAYPYPGTGVFIGIIEVDQNISFKVISTIQAHRVPIESKKTLRIMDLGWNREKAGRVRARLSAFEEAWDDPAMDVYNDL